MPKGALILAEHDRNLAYLHRIAGGDEAALAALVEENMGLVRSIALRFKDRGTEYEDLVQIGVIGMIKAAKSFDFSYDTVFSTYAVPLIMGELRRHLRDDGPIKVGRKAREQSLAILRQRENFIKERGREPQLSEICAALGITAEEAASALTATATPRSLHEKMGDGEDGMSLEEILPDPDNPVDMLTDRLALRQAVAALDPMQQKIIYLRYIKELSQQRTGQLLGLSQVKVSREEKKIMQILREAL